MGLSDEKLVDTHSVPAGLRCVICTEVFLDPLCGINCQHVFCAACINRALAVQPQCPLCRVALDAAQLRPCQPIRSLLDDLKVRCDCAASGCGWTGRLEDSVAHQAVCPVSENQQLHDRLARANLRINELKAEKDALAKEKSQEMLNCKKLEQRIKELEQQKSKLQTRNRI